MSAAMTFVLGLTGSIGMGKSTTAALFRRRGVPVHDADATVHQLYRGKAVPLIESAFPGSVSHGVVDRVRLGTMVMHDPEAMARLEAIIHPLVREAEAEFSRAARRRACPLVLLDIPLLFETKGETRCDAILVVSADPSVQKARVLARDGMTLERFDAILARQWPDSDKRRRAHAVIDTGHGLDHAARQVDSLIRAFSGRPGRVSSQQGIFDL
jgi:dephospho-CoA kinase